MATKVKSQISFDETIIKDPELEKLLEKRQGLKGAVSEYEKADKAAKGKILSITTPTPFRVGRFLITKTDVPGKPVAAFETSDTLRITIKTADEK